jgi:hypothetical protein
VRNFDFLNAGQIRPENRNLPECLDFPSDHLLTETNYILWEQKDPPEPNLDMTSCKAGTVDEPTSQYSANDQNLNKDDIEVILDSNLPQKRIYSVQKKAGARCYARWPVNGKYFWGYITEASGHGPYRKYSVSHFVVLPAVFGTDH